MFEISIATITPFIGNVLMTLLVAFVAGGVFLLPINDKPVQPEAKVAFVVSMAFAIAIIFDFVKFTA